MAVRQFNGTSSYLRVDNGTIGQIGNGAFTLLAVVKPTSLNAGEFYIACENGGNCAAGLVDNGNGTGQNAVADDSVYRTATTNQDTTWQILAVTVSGVGGTPRFHRKQLGTGSWTHVNTGDGTWTGNTVSTANVEFASLNDGDFASYKDCRLAVAAVWNSALSDGNIESIDTTPATQTIFDLTPLSLWDFNQANVADDVLDLMGNGADEVADVATTVVTGDDPPDWVFGVGGEPTPIPAYYPGRRVPKRLAGPAQLTVSAATKYTAPADYRAMIRSVHVSNPTGSPVDFTLSIGADAAGTRLFDGYPVPADSYKRWFLQEWLEPEEVIQAFAGTGSALVLTIDGFERPAG